MQKQSKKLPEVTETLTYKSIKEVPNALKKILENEDKIIELAGKIKIIDPAKIYFTGSGSSFNAAEYGEALFQQFMKIPATAKTSLDYVYHTELIGLDTLTIIISVSGKGEATDIARKAKDRGSYVIAITNAPLESELVRISDNYFLIPHEKTKGVVNTTEYVAQLFSVALLVKHLSDDDSKNFGEFSSEIYGLPDKISESFDTEPGIREIAEKEKNREVFVFSGKGPSRIVANQTALKLRETAWTIKHAESIQIDEIPHGRLFCLGDEKTVFILMLSGDVAKNKVDAVSRLISKTGAHIIAICSDTYKFKEQVNLPKTHEYLFPILAQPIAYIWVCYMNRLRNLNIDEPRSIETIDSFLKEREDKKIAAAVNPLFYEKL
jgi:glucosamine--fructose-6-phosphate aminotransferase (isomerizing)